MDAIAYRLQLLAKQSVIGKALQNMGLERTADELTQEVQTTFSPTFPVVVARPSRRPVDQLVGDVKSFGMNLVRSYVHTSSNPLKVTDYEGGTANDRSTVYSNVTASRGKGAERVTAAMNVYRKSDGTLTPITYSDGTAEGLLDLGDLCNVYAQDLSAELNDPRKLE